MRKAIVCEKWELPIKEGEGGYYEYANGRHMETAKNALCVEYLLGKVNTKPTLLERFRPKSLTVLEPFGGVGVFATIVQNVLHPDRHLIWEWDKDCVEQLRFALANSCAKIHNGDAWDIIGTVDADVYVLDFPFCTIYYFEGMKHHWDSIFKDRPKAVLWMDGASRYLHFHKERYGKVFGKTIKTPEDYAQAMSDWYYERYGYTVNNAAYSHGCFYFLATTDKPQPNNLYHVATGVGGLRFE